MYLCEVVIKQMPESSDVVVDFHLVVIFHALQDVVQDAEQRSHSPFTLTESICTMNWHLLDEPFCEYFQLFTYLLNKDS